MRQTTGRKVWEELTNGKGDIKSMKMGISCAVSSAASTGYRRGSGSFRNGERTRCQRRNRNQRGSMTNK